jgi:sec-independent protein translocase protein TatA
MKPMLGLDKKKGSSMGLSIWQLLIIALVVLVLFGRGRISEMMGDFGKGIKSFKQGMNEEDKDSSQTAKQIEGQEKEVTNRVKKSTSSKTSSSSAGK